MVELPATSVARKMIEWVPSTPSLKRGTVLPGAAVHLILGAGNAGSGIRSRGGQNCRRDIPIIRSVRCGWAD